MTKKSWLSRVADRVTGVANEFSWEKHIESLRPTEPAPSTQIQEEPGMNYTIGGVTLTLRVMADPHHPTLTFPATKEGGYLAQRILASLPRCEWTYGGADGKPGLLRLTFNLDRNQYTGDIRDTLPTIGMLDRMLADWGAQIPGKAELIAQLGAEPGNLGASRT